jgi:hypothetical protein
VGDDDISNAFYAWIRDTSSNPQVIRREGVEIYKGPQVYKSANLLFIGDQNEGVVRRTELKFGTYPRKEFEPGYDFDHPERTWLCQGDQIDRVRALLNGLFTETGYYVRVQEGADVGELVQALADGELDISSIAGLIRTLAAVPGVADALAGTELAGTLSALAERSRQRAGLDQLHAAVESTTSSEQDLQAILQEHWWVFGGRYVGAVVRRKLTLGDQMDIPLIRADGALHIVELKKAHIPRLLVTYRDRPVLGPEVHLAVSQAQSYLANLDRQETVIRSEFGLDCRRAFATVVIGHSMYCPDFDRSELSEVLRIYNSHLSRIEVITYEELVDGAERALAIANSADDEEPLTSEDEHGDKSGAAPVDPWGPSDPWGGSPTGSARSDEPPF